MSIFDDIRPYRDNEVPGVISELLKNKEFFNAIAGFQFPKLYKSFPSIARGLVKNYLSKKLKGVKTIAEIQDIIALYVEKILASSTTGLSKTGLDELPQDTPNLFISNHRDIVMDPAMVSFLLHKSVHGTVEIAIGDNLLKKKFISDLMRLNKSFIVKRSVQGREKLMASKQLSQYLHHTIGEGNNIWIAQREGRAKDGLDKTDATILKMFHLGMREISKEAELKDSINNLHVVPVSISYEYDPCAELKAKELFEIEKNGSFEKDDRSDIVSISKGMLGNKGNIHVSFGTEVKAVDNDPIEIAKQIDKQIILNYKLHPSNYIAYEMVQTADPAVGPDLKDLVGNINEIDQKRKEFQDYYNEITDELKPFYLNIYANPVINQFQFKD